MNTIDFQLGSVDALDPYLLIPPGQRVYGGPPAPPNELQEKRIRIRLGERPTVRNLRALFEAGNRPALAGLSLYKSYQIWLIGLTVGIVKEGGWRDVTQLGLQVDLPEKPRFTVVSLLPDTRFIRRVGGAVRCEALMEANGAAQLPDLALATPGIPVSMGASAKVAVHAAVGIDLSFSVNTPVIQAIGKGDRRAEWVLEAHGEPLVGDQELMFTMLAPLAADEIDLRCRLRATISTFDLLPCILQTGTVELQTPLQ